MAKVSEASIASAFLRELGAPDTPLMRKAVIAWLRAESGRTIIGNNPWNIRPNAGDADLRSGVRTSINGNGRFSVYPDVYTGARAAARMLVNAGKDWRHYDRVVKAARVGDPVGFLNALAASAWDAGRYGTRKGKRNRLLSVFEGIGGTGSDTLADPAGKVTSTATTGATAAAGGAVAAGSGVTKSIGTRLADPKFIDIPDGKIITAQDVEYIMSRNAAAGYFANDPAGIGQSITRAILNGAIGKEWNKALRDDLQSQLFAAASAAVPKPLDALGTIASTLLQVTGALLDPANWVRIIALVAGLFMTAWGGANVLRAAS